MNPLKNINLNYLFLKSEKTNLQSLKRVDFPIQLEDILSK